MVYQKLIAHQWIFESPLARSSLRGIVDRDTVRGSLWRPGEKKKKSKQHDLTTRSDIWVESNTINQRTKASWRSKEKEMLLSEYRLCAQVCVCMCSHSTVLFVLGGGRWACVLQKEFDALRSPRNPSLPFCPLSLSWQNCAFSIWGKRPSHRETWPVWGTPHPKTNYKHWQMAA